MPEGDTIHRLAATVRAAIGGRVVTSLAAHTIDDAEAATLVGHRVDAVEARGKNLLVRFDDGRALHVHLRMLGRVRVERPRSGFYRPRTTTPQLRLAVEGAAIVGDRLPVLRLLAAEAEARAPGLATLGPDLLADDFDEVTAIANLRALAARPIGDALLAQHALAGIGNVYKSEVLFLERVDPLALVRTLDDATLVRLVRRARDLLGRNLRGGPRVTRFALAGPRLWVYGRARKPCLVCGGPISVVYQGASPGRSTYYCVRCQPRATR